MVTIHARAKVKADRRMEAVQYAREVALFMKSKPPTVLSVRMYSELFRDVGTIHWFAEHDSLAAFENQWQQYGADPEWQAFVRQADDIFIAGSWQYSVLEPI
jgi:hypothetical protein